MAAVVDFIFDFASPNAYLAHHAIKGIEDRTGAKFNFVPCLLGGIFKETGNQPPMIAFGGIKGKMDYEQLEMRRFIDRHGLTKFKMNPHFPVNTLLMMRAACSIHGTDRYIDYIETGLKAMWEDGQKMDDPNVFVDVLTREGFDGSELLAKTQEPDVKAKLLENTKWAVDRGAFGIPTFFVDGEIFFGKERLGQLEEAILSKA